MKSILLRLLFLILTGFAGCGKQSEGPSLSSGANAYTIAVIPKGTTHEFWKSIHAGAVKAERELNEHGTKVQIIWKGPLREDDRDQQIQVIENFISRRVSGIVVAPLDSKALVRPVATAMRAKIPVVIMDSGLKSDSYVSFVATDNFKGGPTLEITGFASVGRQRFTPQPRRNAPVSDPRLRHPGRRRLLPLPLRLLGRRGRKRAGRVVARRQRAHHHQMGPRLQTAPVQSRCRQGGEGRRRRR